MSKKKDSAQSLSIGGSDKKNYSRSKNGHYIRFNDEIHFRYGPQGKLCIICKPDE